MLLINQEPSARRKSAVSTQILVFLFNTFALRASVTVHLETFCIDQISSTLRDPERESERERILLEAANEKLDRILERIPIFHGSDSKMYENISRLQILSN